MFWSDKDIIIVRQFDLKLQPGSYSVLIRQQRGLNPVNHTIKVISPFTFGPGEPLRGHVLLILCQYLTLEGSVLDDSLTFNTHFFF